MSRTASDKVARARAAVPTIGLEEAEELHRSGDALFVDVRDADEVAKSGKIAGAVHVSRGMLEFRADPESQVHLPEFRRDRTIVLYCASGGRSALGGEALQELGFTDVRNLGGFKDWAENGLPVERGGDS